MAVVTLSSPTDNATGVTEPITFSWEAYTGALRYHIQITLSTDTGFASPVIDVMPEGTATSYETSALNAGVSYIWRVRALAELEDLIPVLSLGLSTYDFADTASGSYTDYEFTLSNTGNADAENVTVAITGTGYTKQVDLVSSTIAAAEHGHFTARFSPTEVAEFNSGLITVSWPNRDDITATLTGTGTSGSAFTTYFSSNWDSASIPVDGGPDAWTTETDTLSTGAVTDGKYVITLSASNTVSYLYHLHATTGYYDTRTKFDLLLSNVTGYTAGRYVNITDTRGQYITGIQLYLKANGATSLNSVYMIYEDGNNVAQTLSTIAYTFVAGHTYTFDLRFKLSSNTSTSDGYYQLYISDNGGTAQEVYAETAITTYLGRTAGIRDLRLGAIYISSAITETFTFDNYTVGYK